MTDIRLAVAEHSTLDAALHALQEEVGALPRDAENPFFKSSFSSFPAIKALVDPIAWKHGLFVKQSLDYDGINDTMLNTLYFNHEVAESTIVRLHLVKPDSQAHGSATSYMRRYAYTTCLGLVSASDDDDGNAAQAVTSAPSVAPRATVTRPAPTLAHTSSMKAPEDF